MSFFFAFRFVGCADMLIPIWILKTVIATNCWGCQLHCLFSNEFRDCRCLVGSARKIRISSRLTAVARILRCPTHDFVGANGEKLWGFSVPLSVSRLTTDGNRCWSGTRFVYRYDEPYTGEKRGFIIFLIYFFFISSLPSADDVLQLRHRRLKELTSAWRKNDIFEKIPSNDVVGRWDTPLLRLVPVSGVFRLRSAFELLSRCKSHGAQVPRHKPSA